MDLLSGDKVAERGGGGGIKKDAGKCGCERETRDVCPPAVLMEAYADVVNT